METPSHRTDGLDEPTDEPTIKGPEAGLEVFTESAPEVTPWEWGYSPVAVPHQTANRHSQYPAPPPEGKTRVRPPRWRSWLGPVCVAGIVATFVSAGAIGGGLGSSLASCEDSLRYETTIIESIVGRTKTNMRHLTVQ